jgi:hypothetical protein
VYNIMKSVIMLNETSLLEELLREELVMDCVGALEYDPDCQEPQKHREFLRDRVVFKEVVPIKDAQVLAKVSTHVPGAGRREARGGRSRRAACGSWGAGGHCHARPQRAQCSRGHVAGAPPFCPCQHAMLPQQPTGPPASAPPCRPA